MNKVLAMILAGGRVDELSVLTLNRPKSAVPFGGIYRIIDFPLSNLINSRIEKAGILLQYHSSSLIQHVGIGAPWDMVGRNRGVFILPPYKAASSSRWYNGTADAILQNFDFIDEFDPEYVLILSGDHIYNMNYQPLIEYHQSKNADLTTVFTKVNCASASRFGLAEIDDEDKQIGGRIINYEEKPQKPASQWASLTIYLINTKTLKAIINKNIQHSGSFEFGRHLIPYMIDHYKVYGYKFYGYWGYTRTIQEYWQSNMDILEFKKKINFEKWGVRTNLDHRAIRDRIPTKFSSKSNVHNSIISSGCKIKGEVINSIIAPGVRISKGAKVSNSIIMFDTHIKRNAVIENTILDTDIVIGENASIGGVSKKQKDNSITVIGSYTKVPSSIKIGQGCIIYPKKAEKDFTNKVISSGEIIK